MSRRLRYQVAASLDGFIAGPNGEYDWIVMDPSLDFAALYKQFDTAVMGRKTYEAMTAQGGDGTMPGLDVVVFSRTLPPSERPGVRVVNADPCDVVRSLKERRGRDIWLFGGGQLFRSLLDAGLVDTVEVAVSPVLLGTGVALLPPGSTTKLVLSDQRILPASGTVVLAYSMPGAGGPAPRISFIKHAGKRVKTRRKSRTPAAERKGVLAAEKLAASRGRGRTSGRTRKAPRR